MLFFFDKKREGFRFLGMVTWSGVWWGMSGEITHSKGTSKWEEHVLQLEWSWHPNVKILKAQSWLLPSGWKVLLGRVYNGSPRCVPKSVVSWMVYCKQVKVEHEDSEGWSSGFPSSCVVRCVLWRWTAMHAIHTKNTIRKMNNDWCFCWVTMSQHEPPFKKKIPTDQKWSFSLGAHPHCHFISHITPPRSSHVSKPSLLIEAPKSYCAQCHDARHGNAGERLFTRRLLRRAVTFGNVNVTVTTLKLHLTACKTNPQKMVWEICFGNSGTWQLRHVSCRECIAGGIWNDQRLLQEALFYQPV